MKTIEVLKLSAKIGVGIGVGTVVWAATLKCCNRLIDGYAIKFVKKAQE